MDSLGGHLPIQEVYKQSRAVSPRWAKPTAHLVQAIEALCGLWAMAAERPELPTNNVLCRKIAG